MNTHQLTISFIGIHYTLYPYVREWVGVAIAGVKIIQYGIISPHDEPMPKHKVSVQAFKLRFCEGLQRRCV